MKGKKVKTIRFPVMFIALAAMVITCVVYVALHGATFTAEQIYYSFNDPGSLELSAETLDRSIVEVDKVYFNETDILCVDVHSVGKGYTEVNVNVRSAGDVSDGIDQTITIPLYVNFMGTVFQTDNLNFDGYLLIQLIIEAGIAIVIAVTGYTFIESFRKGRFTYSTVACGGIALFLLFLITISVYNMQWMNTFRRFLWDISDSGYMFALLTSPFMLLIAGAIAISNISLMRHEGRRPQNMLGIALAVMWILGLAAIDWLPQLFSNQDFTAYTVGLRIAYSIGYVLTFMECMLLSTIVSAFLSTKYRPPYDKDYIIILGCCIRDDGTLTPILRGRVDAAIKFEREQFAATGKHAKFVPSGGQGPDEVISESEAMKRYLMEQGYPSEQIVMEDKSVNTNQNIQFSRDRIREDAGTLDGVKAGFATTNYHIFRGYVLSKKHGLDAQGISAKTKWYFYPNAFLREFVGLIFDKKWFISLTILLILVFYTLGVYLLYISI